MEEIKMKAKTTKTNKTEQFINVMPIISLILLALIMTFYSNISESNMSSSIETQKSYAGYINSIFPPGNQFIIPVNSKSNDNATEKQSMCFMVPMNGFCSAGQVNQNLEIDKLIERNNDRLYLSRNDKKEFIGNSKSDSQNSELNLLAEKVSEFLIPAEEPELEFVILPFPEEQQSARKYYKNEYLEYLVEIKVKEAEEFYAYQQKLREYLVVEKEPELEFVKLPFPEEKQLTRKYCKNEYLENLVRIKVKEAEELYAYQQKLREYFIVEKEFPLELEDWMINEECWCFDKNPTLASNEDFKKD